MPRSCCAAWCAHGWPPCEPCAADPLSTPLPQPRPSPPAGAAAGPSWPEEVVQELCKHTAHPLIFPLSNPTDKAEITAEQAYT